MTKEENNSPPPAQGGAARKDFRVALSVSVRYRVAKKIGDVYKLTPFHKGLGVDFSGGGGAFKIGKDIPAGYLMYLEIFFPFDKFPVSVVAEVVRTKEDTLKGQKVYLCITRYLLMSPTINDKMVGYFINEGARQAKKQSA
jgi:c-di-GMP-binding flagellar brake protein YcgR